MTVTPEFNRVSRIKMHRPIEAAELARGGPRVLLAEVPRSPGSATIR